MESFELGGGFVHHVHVKLSSKLLWNVSDVFQDRSDQESGIARCGSHSTAVIGTEPDVQLQVAWNLPSLHVFTADLLRLRICAKQ